MLVSSNLSSVRLKSLGDNILGLCVGEGIMVPGHRSSSSRGREEDGDTLAAAEDTTAGVDCMKAGLRLESQQQLGAGCRAAGCTAALSADTVQLHPVSLYSCTRQARLYSCTRQGCTAALLHSAPHTASLRPLDGCLGVSPAASPASPAQRSPAQPGYCLQWWPGWCCLVPGPVSAAAQPPLS